MLQLSKNQATNTVAFYPNALITSSAVTSVYFSGSQDYDRFPSTFTGNIISNYLTTPWVVVEVSGSSLPTPTGFFTYNIYEYSVGDLYIWNLTNVDWDSLNDTWDAAGAVTIGNLLATERAFNSGSDVPVFTQYVSPDENGTYTTYLG